MRSTVMRVPATTGLPIITFGSETIVGSVIVSLLVLTLAEHRALQQRQKIDLLPRAIFGRSHRNDVRLEDRAVSFLGSEPGASAPGCPKSRSGAGLLFEWREIGRAHV